MNDPTLRTSLNTRISTAVTGFAAMLFRRSDARARARGWDVTVGGRYGTGRSYRDPRFDRFAVCGRCAGQGCDRCGGTGRIVRTASDAGAPEWGVR